MAGVSKIQYLGKEIIYVDYRGLNEEEMIVTANKAKNIVLTENKPHLQLTNTTGTKAGTKFLRVAREIAKETKHLTEKAAIVGIESSAKIILTTYNLFAGGKLIAFDSEDEAKEYLTN